MTKLPLIARQGRHPYLCSTSTYTCELDTYLVALQIALFWTTHWEQGKEVSSYSNMAFLKKIGRGHGITIDHDLSVGLSRDSFLVDHVHSFLVFKVDGANM